MIAPTREHTATPTTAGAPCPLAGLCSTGSRLGPEDPVGRATVYDLQVFVEVPLPWADAVVQSRHFPRELRAVRDQAISDKRSIGLIALAPDPAYSVAGLSRVLAFRRPNPPFSRYDRAEYLVPDNRVAKVVSALVEGREHTARFELDRQATDDVRDLFVCTHGTHDACCGLLGVPFFDHARRTYGDVARTGVRVWRTSHFGGHRFAPTMLDLPQNRAWAYLTPETLAQIVTGTGPLESLRQHYRGWAGLASPLAQVAERELLMRDGWAWTTRAVEARVAPSADDSRADVRLVSHAPDGAVTTDVAIVETCGTSPILSHCMGDASATNVPRYRVTRLARLESSSSRRGPSASPSPFPFAE